jgi:PPOX class probable F420-dependent enzyme
MLDLTTPAGEHAAERLSDELIIWLVTVTPAGQPQASPVWFLWDGETFLVYSQPKTSKLRSLAANPRVCLHLDGNGRGGDVVVIEGDAAVDTTLPPADRVPEYVQKYGERITANRWTPASFAADYSVPIRIGPRRARVW